MLTIFLVFLLMPSSAQRLTLTFSPENGERKFDAAVEEYRRIWAAEGDHIIRTMEEVTKLKFPDENVKVEVFEGPSNSGFGPSPMKLRASYPADIKKGTLAHELGHRMIVPLKKRPAGLDEHRVLFLYLYDLWEALYGKEFADKEVAFERTLKGLYAYDSAWTSTLAMTREERRARFAAIVKDNGQ